MNIPFENFIMSKKLELTITSTALIIAFKIIFPIPHTFILGFINAIIIFNGLFFGIIYTSDFTAIKKSSPITLIVNAGILTIVLFFLSAVSAALFDRISDLNSSIDFLYSLLSTLVALVYIGSICYIFSAFRELFFLRQKKDPQKYFNAMTVVLSLAFFSSSLTVFDKDFDYITLSFFVVSIVLISINSLRVSWIAFLVKKQKLTLLLISIILSGLFGINFALTYDQSFINQLLVNFSPGLHMAYSLVMIYGAIYFGVIFFTALFHLPTAEAFDRKAQELSSLMDLSKLITQVFDFKELADSVTAVTTKVCSSDSAWLVIKNGEEYELTSVNNIGYVEAEQVTNYLIEEGSVSYDELVTFDRKLIKIKIKTDIRTFDFKALAIAPLKVHKETKGFLFTGRKENFSFDEDERNSVGAFADYAAVALENAKLIEESIEKERLESELKVARDIQYKILPAKTPKFESLDISALFVPAFEVGGDYYDFFHLGENKLGFVCADVSGKGISAAFIMAEVKGIFESLSKLIQSPKELLTSANEILKNSLEKKSFVTAVYGVVDIDSGKLVFSRAGHVPVYRCSNGNVKKLIPGGIGLGLDEGSSFSETMKEMEIQLENNDIVALYSDGITEAMNEKQEEFGYRRFEEILCEYYKEDVDTLSNKIMSRISVFSQNSYQHDDITLVLFKWFSNNKKLGED